MIPDYELERVIEKVKRNDVEKLYLVGSSLKEETEKAKDYEFVVSGVPEGIFFKFYRELSGTCQKM